ncbi:hypothetical protein [Streptomyces sp. AM6-12]|uniref:hypothetical protein n=1 Tax=Streptomyces sp. AM6-12 TaxID=3345149 RepID=UPI0037983733
MERLHIKAASPDQKIGRAGGYLRGTDITERTLLDTLAAAPVAPASAAEAPEGEAPEGEALDSEVPASIPGDDPARAQERPSAPAMPHKEPRCPYGVGCPRAAGPGPAGPAAPGVRRLRRAARPVRRGRRPGHLVPVAGNVRIQLFQAAPTPIVALGMALVIGTEGDDLSVGAVIALAASVVPLYRGPARLNRRPRYGCRPAGAATPAGSVLAADAEPVRHVVILTVTPCLHAPLTGEWPPSPCRARSPPGRRRLQGRPGPAPAFVRACSAGLICGVFSRHVNP